MFRTASWANTRTTSLRSALCLVDTELPMLGTLTRNGVPLLHAKSLAKRINAVGPVTSDDVRAVAAELATRVPVRRK
jgi:hypothetical protein